MISTSVLNVLPDVMKSTLNWNSKKVIFLVVLLFTSPLCNRKQHFGCNLVVQAQLKTKRRALPANNTSALFIAVSINRKQSANPYKLHTVSLYSTVLSFRGVVFL